MYITDKYVFCHLNKAAGCFVKDYMLEHMGASIHKYKHAPLRMLSEKYRKRIKTGAIRNPFSWYVSYFTYHKENGRFKTLNFEQYLKTYTVYNRALLSLMPKKLRKKFSKLYPPRTKMPVGAYTFHYINYFCYDAINVLKHWDYEYFKLNINKVSNLDVTFRTESLKEDMIKEFGEEHKDRIIKFKRRNVSSNKKPYQDFYTHDLVEVVKKYDGPLMNYLNYEL